MLLFTQIARKLRDIGDHLDARVKKEIVEATSALLDRRSVFQVNLLHLRAYHSLTSFFV